MKNLKKIITVSLKNNIIWTLSFILIYFISIFTECSIMAVNSFGRRLAVINPNEQFFANEMLSAINLNVTTEPQRLDSLVYAGNLKSAFSYDSLGNLLLESELTWNSVSASWDEIAKTEYVWDNQGFLLQEADFFLDSLTNQIIGNKKLQYIRNNDGFVTVATESYWDTALSQWILSAKSEFTLNQNGEKIQQIDYYWNLTNNSWTYDWKFDFSLDVNENAVLLLGYYWEPTTSLWTEGWKAEYAYDSSNNLTSQIAYYKNQTSGQWIQYEKIEFTYVSGGYISLQTSYYKLSQAGPWIQNEKYEYSYDTNGNVNVQTASFWSTSINAWVNNWKFDYTYNNDFFISDLIIPHYYHGNILFNHMLTNYIYSYWDGSGSNWVQNESWQLFYSSNPVVNLSTSFAFERIIFPNPVENFVYFQFNQPVSSATLTIVNTSGQFVLKQKITSNEMIPVSALTTGLYFFNLNFQNRNFSGRFVKSN
jgi:hypothetical protein